MKVFYTTRRQRQRTSGPSIDLSSTRTKHPRCCCVVTAHTLLLHKPLKMIKYEIHMVIIAAQELQQQRHQPLMVNVFCPPTYDSTRACASSITYRRLLLIRTTALFDSILLSCGCGGQYEQTMHRQHDWADRSAEKMASRNLTRLLQGSTSTNIGSSVARYPSTVTTNNTFQVFHSDE